MIPENDPADDITEEEYYRGMVEAQDESGPPAFGFNGTCVECGKDLHPDEYEQEACDDCLAEMECD